VAAAVLACAAGCATLPGGSPADAELTAVPFFPQSEYQCGPAALATVLTAAGVPVTPQSLVDEVYVPARRGSLQPEMMAAARRRGLLALTIEPNVESLLAEIAAGHPVLVLQNLGVDAWPVWHYAVVIGFDRDSNRVLLRSGTTERLEVSGSRFAGSWQRADNWGVVLLLPGQRPAVPDFTRYMAAASDLDETGPRGAVIPAYRTAIELWPDAALPRLALANALLKIGDASAAEQVLIEAVGVAPGDPALRNNLADLLLRRGCLVAAQREIELARAVAAGTLWAATIEATASEIASGAMQNPAPGEDCP
jgi:tetratricopeptide (TPR) repeat protein